MPVKVGDVVVIRHGRAVPITEVAQVTKSDISGTISEVHKDGSITVSIDQTHAIFIRPAFGDLMAERGHRQP